jgi:hypothetical protein
MEAARISLKPGASHVYNEDGTLFYKLDKHSSYDAAEHIKGLADVLHADDNQDYESSESFWDPFDWWRRRLLNENDD